MRRLFAGLYFVAALCAALQTLLAWQHAQAAESAIIGEPNGPVHDVSSLVSLGLASIVMLLLALLMSTISKRTSGAGRGLAALLTFGGVSLALEIFLIVRLYDMSGLSLTEYESRFRTVSIVGAVAGILAIAAGVITLREPHGDQ